MITLGPAGVVQAGAGTAINVIGHTATTKIASDGVISGSYTFELISPPGAGVPPHVHEHEDEMIYVVDGDLDVMIDGEMIAASSGAVLNFARGTAHAFFNNSDRPARTLWCVTPGRSFEHFFGRLAALPPGEPDPAVLVPLFAEYGMTILPPA